MTGRLPVLVPLVFLLATAPLEGCGTLSAGSLPAKAVICPHSPAHVPMAGENEPSETWCETWIVTDIDDDWLIVDRKNESLRIPRAALDNMPNKLNGLRVGDFLVLWFNVKNRELVSLVKL